jgi:alpha-N-arabinofuranosidase
LNNFAQFDNYRSDRNLTANFEIGLMEYSVFQLDNSNGFVDYTDPPELHPHYPRMTYAIGEAVYLLSAERNPDLVTLSAYAPGFENRNSYAWTPNMISFTAASNETVLSTSYWQQRLFSTFRGTQSVPILGEINPLFYAADINNSTGSLYVKVGRRLVLTDLDCKHGQRNGTRDVQL